MRGPAPDVYEADNVNRNASVNVGDTAYLINYAFRDDSPAPCDNCP